MKARRGRISNETKIAALICQIYYTHDEAVELTEEAVLRSVRWDHYPTPHAEGGEDVHYNLQALLIEAHDLKTRKVDVPGIAKRKRVTKAHEEFRARMLMPRDERPPKRSKWASRPFQKRSRTK